MKKLFMILTIIMLSGCSTVAGTISGFGEDVKSGTDTVVNWIKPNKENKK